MSQKAISVGMPRGPGMNKRNPRPRAWDEGVFLALVIPMFVASWVLASFAIWQAFFK